MPRWLVEIGTPNGLRSRAFLGSSPSWGTSSNASMVKLADTPGLSPDASGHGGSSPSTRTKMFDK